MGRSQGLDGTTLRGYRLARQVFQRPHPTSCRHHCRRSARWGPSKSWCRCCPAAAWLCMMRALPACIANATPGSAYPAHAQMLQNVFGDKCLDKRFTADAPKSSWLSSLLPPGLARLLGGKRKRLRHAPALLPRLRLLPSLASPSLSACRMLLKLPCRRSRPMHRPGGGGVPEAPRRAGAQVHSGAHRGAVHTVRTARAIGAMDSTAGAAAPPAAYLLTLPRFLPPRPHLPLPPSAPGCAARQPQRLALLGVQGLHRGRSVQGADAAEPQGQHGEQGTDALHGRGGVWQLPVLLGAPLCCPDPMQSWHVPCSTRLTTSSTACCRCTGRSWSARPTCASSFTRVGAAAGLCGLQAEQGQPPPLPSHVLALPRNVGRCLMALQGTPTAWCR